MVQCCSVGEHLTVMGQTLSMTCRIVGKEVRQGACLQEALREEKVVNASPCGR